MVIVLIFLKYSKPTQVACLRKTHSTFQSIKWQNNGIKSVSPGARNWTREIPILYSKILISYKIFLIFRREVQMLIAVDEKGEK